MVEPICGVALIAISSIDTTKLRRKKEKKNTPLQSIDVLKEGVRRRFG